MWITPGNVSPVRKTDFLIIENRKQKPVDGMCIIYIP